MPLLSAAIPASAADPTAPAPQAGPIFIVGCYRSGTTLMEKVLEAHGDFAGLSFETHFFTHILPGRPLPEFNQQRWAPPLRAALGVESWEQVMTDRLQAYTTLMAGAARQRSARRWIEKTPDHLFDVGLILRCFPGAKVLAMLRDGRDVIASIASAPYILPRVRSRRQRILAACAMWQWMTEETIRIASRHPREVLLVRYERLTSSPTVALREVSRFLGLDPSMEAVTDWIDHLGDIEANSSFSAFHGLKPPPPRGRTGLSEEESRAVTDLVAPTLRRAGYIPNQSHSSAAGVRAGNGIRARMPSSPSPGTPGEGRVGVYFDGPRREPPPQPSPGVPGEGEDQQAQLRDGLLAGVSVHLFKSAWLAARAFQTARTHGNPARHLATLAHLITGA